MAEIRSHDQFPGILLGEKFCECRSLSSSWWYEPQGEHTKSIIYLNTTHKGLGNNSSLDLVCQNTHGLSIDPYVVHIEKVTEHRQKSDPFRSLQIILNNYGQMCSP